MNRRRQRAHANGSALKLLDNRQQQFSIHFVEAVGIDLHSIEGVIRHFMRDAPVIINVRIVAHAPQEPINNAGRATRSTRDFMRAAVVNLDIQDAGRTLADCFQVFGDFGFCSRNIVAKRRRAEYEDDQRANGRKVAYLSQVEERESAPRGSRDPI